MLVQWSFRLNDHGGCKSNGFSPISLFTHTHRERDATHTHQRRCPFLPNLNVFAILLSRLHFEIWGECEQRVNDMSQGCYGNSSPHVCLRGGFGNCAMLLGPFFFQPFSHTLTPQSIPLMVDDFGVCNMYAFVELCVCVCVLRKWVHSRYKYNRQTNVHKTLYTLLMLYVRIGIFISTWSNGQYSKYLLLFFSRAYS